MTVSFTTSFTVDQTPAEVFAAVSSVRGWWSQLVEGDTDQLGAIFHYYDHDIHNTKFKITEYVPNQKIVWNVLENYFNVINDKSEWIGTNVVFDITAKDGKTELRFTHVGLVPEYECYNNCSNAWGYFVNTSLRNLITSGMGGPIPADKAERTVSFNF